MVVEDEEFGREMEEMYLEDLAQATEIVLERRRRVRPAGDAHVAPAAAARAAPPRGRPPARCGSEMRSAPPWPPRVSTAAPSSA